jgi:hypothetical protein
MKKVVSVFSAILIIAIVVSCKRDKESTESSQGKSNPSVRYRVIKKSAAIRDNSSINSKIVRTESSGEVVYIDSLSVSEGIQETVEGKAGRWLKLSDSSTPCFVFSTDVKAEIDLFKPPFRMDNEIVYKKCNYQESCAGGGSGIPYELILDFKEENVVSIQRDEITKKYVYNGKYQKIYDHVYLHFNEIILLSNKDSSSEPVIESKKAINCNVILKFTKCPEEGHHEILLKTIYTSSNFDIPDTDSSNCYWRE